MAYTLTIPTFKEALNKKGDLWWVSGDDLWWVKGNVSSGTLYRIGGSWHFDRTPDNSVLLTADKVYRGGYENVVDEDTAATLVAAGFGDWLDPFDVFSDEFSDEFS